MALKQARAAGSGLFGIFGRGRGPELGRGGKVGFIDRELARDGARSRSVRALERLLARELRMARTLYRLPPEPAPWCGMGPALMEAHAHHLRAWTDGRDRAWRAIAAIREELRIVSGDDEGGWYARIARLEAGEPPPDSIELAEEPTIPGTGHFR